VPKDYLTERLNLYSFFTDLYRYNHKRASLMLGQLPSSGIKEGTNYVTTAPNAMSAV
jgi:hypothetical protein